jgi:glycosyltransferase involved in cell wall biosynthesis
MPERSAISLQGVVAFRGQCYAKVSMSVRITIVLPTFNRRPRLERVLAGLDRQSVAPECFEVVIVDDGSTDDTQEWLSRNSNRRYAVTALRQVNAGPATARNAGIAAARGKFLLFIDDDVEPTEDLVAEHLRCHEAEAGVVVIGPLASLPHYAQPWVAWEQAKLEAQYTAMLRGDWQPSFRQFWTGNASVPKADVLAVGSFDPSFLRGEDVELGRRLHDRGLGFRFNPKARGLHHAERSLAAWEKMHASYGALEVRIFGGLGEEQLLETLAQNWSRVHRATHWLVNRCIGNPLCYAAATRSLRSWLKVGAAVDLPIAAEQVCGALANVIYWEASARTLGEARSRRVFRRGDELRAAAK